MDRRITAPMLDELLGMLTPEMIEEIKAHIPVGYADQIVAAQDQSIRLAEHLRNAKAGGVPPAAVAEWVRLGALDALIGWIGGTARTCLHQPHWHTPEPVFACAWRPGVIACIQCLHLLGVTGVADQTCDGCGHACLGVEVGDPIYPSVLWVGALSFEYGACIDCQTDTPTEQTA